MARHRHLAAATRVKIYFAERSSPRQRGANENYNGLLRQYFPNGHRPVRASRCARSAVMSELNNPAPQKSRLRHTVRTFTEPRSAALSRTCLAPATRSGSADDHPGSQRTSGQFRSLDA
jgi:hypothetical protein